MTSPRFKGLGSISPDNTPPPPVPPAVAVASAPPVAAATDVPGSRFAVPHMERYMGPLREYNARMCEYYDTLQLRDFDLGFSRGAKHFGLEKEYRAVTKLQDRVDQLALRGADDSDFEKSVGSLESSFRNFLVALDAAVPRSQGSLL